jgi:riboflavin transporter FmnP
LLLWQAFFVKKIKKGRVLQVTNSKAKQLSIIAILSAISAILMVFIQIPMFAGFMKLDFSVVPVLIGMYILGFPSGVAILLLRSVLKMLLMPELPSDIVGMPMNIIAMFIFIWVIYLFDKQDSDFTLKKFFVGALSGTAALTLVMAVLNAVYAIPMYAKLMNFSLDSLGMNLTKWIVTIVLPFNLVQGVVLSIASFIILQALRSFIQMQKS